MKKRKIHYSVSEILNTPSTNLNNSNIIEIGFVPPHIEELIISLLEKEYGDYIFLDRDRLKNVESGLSKVEKRLDDLEKTSKNIIIIEEMDMKAARQKVLDYTEKHKIFDIEELHQNIRCDLKLLIKIIDELKNEGKIVEET